MNVNWILKDCIHFSVETAFWAKIYFAYWTDINPFSFLSYSLNAIKRLFKDLGSYFLGDFYSSFGGEGSFYLFYSISRSSPFWAIWVAKNPSYSEAIRYKFILFLNQKAIVFDYNTLVCWNEWDWIEVFLYLGWSSSKWIAKNYLWYIFWEAVCLCIELEPSFIKDQGKSIREQQYTDRNNNIIKIATRSEKKTIINFRPPQCAQKGIGFHIKRHK